ncbi:divalent-cation tolerance protein CutA [Aliidiomarina halalkaliphila]|uniref:Divalent-cation tolerance protein CutA n=1 Tax=Aliidiomarina halalkaliphila TaxID=2593535 RepID=A0A552X1P7_9GAMM|nr:divalent-cation tolerance protein CutA [Aliidiomarina halalkaliphila]TRW48523.1 divalent-cation tolerance protein CutA [Aliidiomarina halalkaliphila]
MTLMVFCTVPDIETARDLASRLVKEKLVACVNIQPGIESVYEWQGNIEQSNEVMLILKTTDERYQALEQQLQEWHPYDTPEILAVPVAKGLSDYIQWVAEVTART